MALNEYIAQLRDLLHDPSSNNWSNAQLTKYINNGRQRVCQDTKCLRQLVPNIALVAAQEQYQIATIASAASLDQRVIDVMAIDFYWGTTRYPLAYLPWTVLNARYRYWQNLTNRCEAWTRMGGLSIYVAPIPDQAYRTDWIIAINPLPLVDDTTVEEIPPPFTDPIIYWAAYIAKFGEQSMGEAAIFKNEYKERRGMVQRSFMTINIPDHYANA